MFEQLEASLKKFGSLKPDQLSLLFDCLKVMEIKKDQYLVKETQICQSFYFINKGNFRHFRVEDNGEESTLNLFITNEWVLEYKSFLSQLPSESMIQATEDSEVFALSVWDFHQLVKVSDGFFQLGKIFQLSLENQDYQNNRLSPEEKYELLLARKPQLLQHFPLKHIASYLGMTPETLSRVRKKISS